VSGGTLGCLVIFILWAIDATTGWRVRIAPRLSTRTLSDRVAWLTFSIGVWVMLWIVLLAAMGESDGDYREWDEIRRQVRAFLAAGILAAALPFFVTIWHWMNRRRFQKNVQGGRQA
jgi:cbb3-type cytochrome oxidase subunit 1